MDNLRVEWDAATSFAAGDTAEKWWKIIDTRYSEEGRHFHNHSYLSSIFTHYHKYLDKLHNSQSVLLAIFFHKLCYKPRETDNDSKIIGEFKTFMKEAGEGHEELCDAVIGLLESAATNLTEAHMTEGSHGCEDVHYFLDFTMGVLGSSTSDYNNYTTKIQLEYSHLTEEAFVKLRKKILQNLLLIPNVYATKEFQTEYEKTATENIQKEIERLKN